MAIDKPEHGGEAAETRPPAEQGVDRRVFLAGAAAFTGAAGVLGFAALSPGTVEKILERQFRELSPEGVERLVQSLEEEYKARFGKDVTVLSTPPIGNTVFGYGLDLSRCIGCRRCVYACVRENNQSRDPQIQWIRVLRMEKRKGVDLHESEAYYYPEEVPEDDHFYFPVQCHHCENPPCTKVCPVNATWSEPDGIVVIDYDWCIGCRCCMAACPYGARRFNWGEPTIRRDEVNPVMHALGNRMRMKGVVEKCTFCIQRTRSGLYPACVEICPVGVRKFGNLLDEKSEIRTIMREKRVFILKADLNTRPRFFYFYSINR